MRRAALSIAIVASAALPLTRAGGGAANPHPSGTVALQGADGRVLYLKNCRQCHSATGEPSSETKHKYPKIKSLNDSAFLAKLSDDSILTVMKKGAGKDMKSFSDKLTADEMRAVLEYVRTLPAKNSGAK